MKKLAEPGEANMKAGAMMNYLHEKCGVQMSYKKQVKVFLTNYRRKKIGRELGVSSYGGVITKIETELKADILLASPEATLDTCVIIGCVIP